MKSGRGTTRMTDQALNEARMTEDLYRPILAALRETMTPKEARNYLDGILSLGKAAGRRTALREQSRPVEEDPLYSHWIQCVEWTLPAR